MQERDRGRAAILRSLIRLSAVLRKARIAGAQQAMPSNSWIVCGSSDGFNCLSLVAERDKTVPIWGKAREKTPQHEAATSSALPRPGRILRTATGGGNRSHRKGHVFRGWRLLARVGETNRLARVATIKIAHYRVGRRRPIRQQNEGDSP